MAKRKWTYKKETIITPASNKKFFLAHANATKTKGSKVKISKWKGKVGGTGYKITYNRRIYKG